MSENKPNDALSFVSRMTARPLTAGVFLFIFLFPLIGNFAARISKHGKWLNDYDALACGAHTLGLGQSPYSLHPVCAGLHPSAYVYAPQVAEFFEPFVNRFGNTGSQLAYLWLLLPATALILWYMLAKAYPRAPWQFRLMTMAAINGSALACGNIAFVLHGLIIASALILRRTRIPFIAAVVLGALVKPVLLTYLIVLIYEDRKLWQRAMSFAVGTVAGLAAVALVLLTSGPFGSAWRASLSSVVMHDQPGISSMAFISALGLGTGTPAALVLLVLFTAVMTAGGFVLVRWGGLDADERVMVGIGVALLINPRLQDYDMYMLAPFMATIVMMAKPMGEKTFTWISWIFTGTLLFSVLQNIFEMRFVHRAPVTIFVYCGLMLYVAVRVARRHQAEIRALVKDPKAIFARAA